MIKKDVIVIGAGAAGLMAGIEAGKRGRSVLILDRAGKTGSKIRISGGGRCNFTNRSVSAENYSSENPHFCKSALSRFTPSDIIEMLGRYDIPFEEKEAGRLFLRQSAAEMVRMLERECERNAARLQLQCVISGMTKERGSFILVTNKGTFGSESVVVATGGLSYPALGASGFGHSIARRFGMRVTPVKPALVPFVLKSKDIGELRSLSGISLEAEAACGGKSFRDKILFTHRGLSGPAILQSSVYWNKTDVISIDLLPGFDVHAFLNEKRAGRMELRNALSAFFPDRFAAKWCDLQGRSRPLNQYSQKEVEEIADRLHNWEIRPAETEGYVKAEVTAGGVDTAELSSKTMEAKKVPGLYFVGEVVDVTGQLGGYNLHWAWASGHAAGRYA